jgi:hypothetical protein
LRYLLILSGFILLAAGCGTSEPVAQGDAGAAADTTEGYTLPVADNYLYVTDSIGIELGDSNYVFGVIGGAEFTPDGNIAILDSQQSRISLFSPDGVFIRNIGRNGSGPGEFLMPVGMSFRPEGGLVVSDGMGQKIVYFDENYEYISDEVGFFPSPPALLVAINGMEIVGMKPDFEQTEEGMFMGFTVGRWAMGDPAPSVVYATNMSPFDPSDLSAVGEDVILFTATRDGIVFTAPMSTEEYTFTAWTAEGEEIFTFVDENFQRVMKTTEEMDIERELTNAQMIRQGMPPEMANWEPDPYRRAIAALYIDGQNRLWVASGTSTTPFFNIYDLNGNYLSSAAIDAGIRSEHWQVGIGKEHFIAFDADPEDYTRAFIGDLPVIE